MTPLDHLAHATHQPGDQPAGASGPRVLLVDPNPQTRRTLLDVLRMHQLTVAEAADGGGALQATREWHPSVVVMELRLGQNGQDGVQVMKAMLDIDPNLKVIIHTAGLPAARSTMLTRLGVYRLVAKGGGATARLVEAILAAHRTYAHRAVV